MSKEKWIAWPGAEKPPVEEHIFVDVMFRTGKQHHFRDAGNWMWFWGKKPGDVDITCKDDIIAYRICEE